MNLKQFDENTSKLNKSEDERQEKSSVIQVYIPEICSVAGLIRKFPSSFASLTLVHMDGKSKDNRKLNQVINESSEFLFTEVILRKYRCKVRNSLGVLSEEDRWYRDKNLAYVGHSVRKNIRDANEHMTVVLLSLDSSDMGLKGTDNFAFGSSVEEKVDEIKEIGAVDNFKNHGDVIGFNSEYQWGGTNVNLDYTIQAAEMNIPKIEYLVELSLKPQISVFCVAAESERIKFLEKMLEGKPRLQGKMLMLGCYNLYNNKEHYATMFLLLFLPAMKYIWKKIQVPKLKVQKPVTYWEGRGARMKGKWKIMADSYHPP
ncbi:unnamed protein product [Cuscuta epithymum]|uniref:Uncharacterized protein n=1 Tax=Cuscuta epithymum TaxID=186058 RepID=A0AAV0FUM4_9ASTE|nr:unnamed protein product [Cuscuta epithymum]